MAINEAWSREALDLFEKALEDDYKKRYESGDSMALLQAIAQCAITGLPMPEWLEKAYLLHYREFAHFKVKTLDEAFGVSRKGMHLNAQRKKWKKKIPVYLKVKELHESNPDKYPIAEDLFSKVGKQFNISGSTVSDYYYEYKNQFEANLQK